MKPMGSARDIFSKLFRSEYLAKCPVPLSSDAFSSFGVLDSDLHNGAVAAASDAFLDKHIPAVAASLTADDTHHVTRVLQQYGVNARFLGCKLQRASEWARASHAVAHRKI